MSDLVEFFSRYSEQKVKPAQLQELASNQAALASEDRKNSKQLPTSPLFEFKLSSQDEKVGDICVCVCAGVCVYVQSHTRGLRCPLFRVVCVSAVLSSQSLFLCLLCVWCLIGVSCVCFSCVYVLVGGLDCISSAFESHYQISVIAG